MGRVRSHTRRQAKSLPKGVLDVRYGGYGFVRTAEGEFFIPEAKLGCAFHGDLVEVSPLPRRGGQSKHRSDDDYSISASDRPAARVVRVLDRAHETLVGRYEIAEPFGVVVPEDPRMHHDVFTMLSDNPDIPDGFLVRVRLTTYPDRGQAATGVVEEVLGDYDDRSSDVDVIIARHKLETVFSEASLKQAEEAQLDVESALGSGYRDLRDRVIFTVDPSDAKDFDDAVSLDPVREGACVWRLGVHIADVSHYVPWGSSIDLDARRRATSVYLVDRVIPMLPERLSNNLCSLRPDEDRLTLTVDLFLDARGVVVKSDVYPAVIRSCSRLTYDQALHMLESGDESTEVARRLTSLSAIAVQRAALRDSHGGIDFDSTEARVRLDQQGKPVAVDIKRKNAATQLVEEAMLMANEAVARMLSEAKFPCVYRVHEQPDEENLDALIPVLREFDWFSLVDEYRFICGDGATVASVVKAAAGRPESELVSSLVLRSMKRAVYRPQCEGHYGLASQAYAHFTSPIRRYPDLIVHRMCKAFWASKTGSRVRDFDAQTQALPWLSEHSSEMERVAEKASRESQECKLIELMEPQIGATFVGVISGVMTYGLYVKLENTAEGLVPLESMGQEYFSFDPLRHCLTGQDSGKTYRLGQRVGVILRQADPRALSLVFGLKA